MEFGHYLDRSMGLAVGLVNSHLPDGTHVGLEDPRDLDRLVRAYGFTPVHSPTQQDLEEVHGLRARLREAFQAADANQASRVLNSLIDETGARPRLVSHDRKGWHLHYVADGATEARRLTAETAVALAAVIAEHGFDRLRVCEGKACGDVFVDRSRNHSRRYCSPEVCGNRASVAAWRARRRQAAGRGAPAAEEPRTPRRRR
jgi:predicted RNA-binding Zn ribbon-like protein